MNSRSAAVNRYGRFVIERTAARNIRSRTSGCHYRPVVGNGAALGINAIISIIVYIWRIDSCTAFCINAVCIPADSAGILKCSRNNLHALFIAAYRAAVFRISSGNLNTDNIIPDIPLILSASLRIHVNTVFQSADAARYTAAGIRNLPALAGINADCPAFTVARNNPRVVNRTA